MSGGAGRGVRRGGQRGEWRASGGWHVGQRVGARVTMTRGRRGTAPDLSRCLAHVGWLVGESHPRLGGAGRKGTLPPPLLHNEISRSLCSFELVFQ